MKTLIAAWLALLAAGPSWAADRAAEEAALVSAAGFAAEDVGYLVVDVAGGGVVAEHNPDRAFIPASVVKIPAIAASLEALGGTHRFATTVHAEGAVVDGRLEGSLTLRGGGDPFLTGEDLQGLARGVAAEGITEVAGGFRYDATELVELAQINPRQPEAAGYNTGVSALSVNFNRVRLNWRKGGSGITAEAAAISENLALPLDVIGFAPAEESPPGPFVRAGAPSEDRWLLSPDLSASGEDWLPVGNPSLVTAQIFRALAAAEGVRLPEPTPGAAPPGAREVARHESVELTEIARGVLRYSNNLSAELIGLAASRLLAGAALGLEDSAAVLTAWWQARLPDVDWRGFYLENHSGLSSRSRSTPRQMVAILLAAAGEPPGGADFHDLLRPIGWKGKEGTAWVKTGTISYGRGLAGYVDTAGGRRLAFAIFFNDLDRRAALDAAFDPRVRAIDPQSRPWRDRALKLEERLVSGWADDL